MRLACCVLFLLVLISSLELATSLRHKHIFALSDKAPAARELNKNEKGKQALRNLLKYYTTLKRNMKELSTPTRKQKPGILGLLKFFGWPPLSELVERVYEVLEPVTGGTFNSSEMEKVRQRYLKALEEFEATEVSMFKDMEIFSDAYEANGPKVNESIKVSWTSFSHNSLVNYTSNDDIHSCQVRTNTAFRIHGVWSIVSTLTNSARHIFKKEGERRYTAEYLYIDEEDIIQAYPLRLKVAFNNKSAQYWQGDAKISSNRSARTNVTDSLSVWGGRPSAYQFGNEQIKDNIAIKAALEKSSGQTKQVQDSKTTSNAAILLFPVLLSLLPLALFADVSDPVTVGYVVFTDFLAVLPLAIKGTELLQVGLSSQIATRTIVRGNLEKNGTVIAETWGVKCNASRSLVVYGAMFILIAVLAMVFGVLLEFFARMKLLRKKQYEQLKSAGTGVHYRWKKKVLCVACECNGGGEDRTPLLDSISMSGGLLSEFMRVKDSH